jgi:multidrug efflux pump subunit AcrA (membrane-fusion protein)
VKRLFAFFFVAGAVLFAVMYFARPTRGDSKDERAKPVSSSSASSATIVAAGRVEPASEEIKIGSELDGKLQSVPVEEGDKVRKGQVVAVLVNGDYAARVALAEATVRERQADLDRVNNGSRSQEKRESEASVREAERSWSTPRRSVAAGQACWTAEPSPEPSSIWRTASISSREPALRRPGNERD